VSRLAYVLTQDRGGPVDVTFTLVKALRETSDHDVRVFGPVPAGYDELLGKHFTRVDVGHKEDLGAIRQMRSALRSWQADVVHAQDRRAALAVAAFPRRPKAVVWTYHGLPYDVEEQWFRGAAHARPPSVYSCAVLAGDALVARRVRRMVVPSLAMEEFLHTRLRVPRRTLTRIDNGVALPDAKPLHGPIRRLIYIGNLYPAKGLTDLLHALSLPDVMPADATLDVVGDGPVRAEAEELARSTLRGRVHFHGFRPGAADLISQYDALVLSSRLEQQPLVVAQAMGAGRPVLATRVGGVPDMLDVPGTPRYLAPPGDIDALATELVRLFANSDPADLGRKLASHARRRFSAVNSAAAHLKLYDSLLAG